jgi:hypothetical protein
MSKTLAHQFFYLYHVNGISPLQICRFYNRTIPKIEEKPLLVGFVRKTIIMYEIHIIVNGFPVEHCFLLSSKRGIKKELKSLLPMMKVYGLPKHPLISNAGKECRKCNNQSAFVVDGGCKISCKICREHNCFNIPPKNQLSLATNRPHFYCTLHTTPTKEKKND